MRLYNSMTGRKEEFIPLDGKNVKMYACGITVYDLSHIGHARQAIAYAMVADYLRYRGYDVKYVRNYTDVDDKIIDRANKLGKDPLEFSREQIEETEKDMANLHITDADVKPKASENIENIIEFHVRFEKIHPFQDGNGRVGRIIIFRECLKNNIMPFYIEERNKPFYIRGIKEYQTNNEKGYLIDTCLNSQDNYEKLAKYFLED